MVVHIEHTLHFPCFPIFMAIKHCSVNGLPVSKGYHFGCSFYSQLANLKKRLINPQITDRGPLDPETSLTSAQEVYAIYLSFWGPLDPVDVKDTRPIFSYGGEFIFCSGNSHLVQGILLLF